MTDPEARWAAECSLPTGERPVRLAEFDALFTSSVRGGERLGQRHLRLTLAGGAQLADAVRELADRETRCCSFFGFTVTEATGGVVQLDIEVPDGHRAVLDALQARAAAVRGQR